MLRWLLLGTGLLGLLGSLTPPVQGMCGYFRPIPIDIRQPSELLQPSQIAFITYDPKTQIETVTVQPRFEGNALDFGMVIPTPGQPTLHEMPRDFFKALGVFSRPRERRFAQSKLLPFHFGHDLMMAGPRGLAGGGAEKAPQAAAPPRPTTVEVLDVGLVGSLEYKVLAAGRADDLHQWLKKHKYNFAGDEATLEHYVQKKYFFTVMRIDTAQMKKNKDGSYTGDVSPTRFTFKSEKLVYPLRITQVSVKDNTEAVFYVQSPVKMDLEGENSYQYNWVSLLENVQNTMGPQDMNENNRNWMKAIQGDKAALIKRAGELGYQFQLGELVERKGGKKTPCTLEWARKLTRDDIGILTGDAAYSERLPDPDEGFTKADFKTPQMTAAIFKVIRYRMTRYQQERPRGYLVREASKEDLALLALLRGHVQQGQFLTRFRKSFTRAEMNEDLVMVPARVGQLEDVSEHDELLRTLHWGGGFRRPPFLGGPGGIRQIEAP